MQRRLAMFGLLVIGCISRLLAQQYMDVHNNAMNVYNTGDYDRAAELFAETSKLAAEEYGKDSEWYANALIWLGDAFFYGGDLSEAIKTFENAETHLMADDEARAQTYAALYYKLGYAYAEDAKFKKSVLRYQQALQYQDTTNSYYAYTLQGLGYAYHALGALQKSEKTYGKALDVFNQTVGTSHTDYINCALAMASLLDESDQIDLADSLYTEIGRQISADHAMYNYWLEGIASHHAFNGQSSGALKYVEELKNRLQAAGRQATLDYARVLDVEARVYMLKENFEKAEALYLQAKEIKERESKNYFDYFISYHYLTEFYQKKGDLSKAIKIYKDLLKLLRKKAGETSSNYIITLSELAAVYLDLGAFEESRELLTEAKTLMDRQGLRGLDYANVLNYLASLYHQTDDLVRAEQTYLKALEIVEKEYAKDHLQYVMILGNLGLLYQDQRLFEKSLAIHHQTIRLLKNIYGFNHPDLITAMMNLALTYSEMGNHDEATQRYLEAIQIGAQQPELNRLTLERLNYNLAYNFLESGNTEKALEYISKNLNKTIKAQTFGEALDVYLTGLIYFEMGQYDEAEKWLRKYLVLIEKLVGDKHERYTRGLFTLARTVEKQNRWEQAASLFSTALFTRLHQVQNNFEFLSEAEKNKYLTGFRSMQNTFYALAVERLDSHPSILRLCYDLQLATKGILFNSAKKIRERVLRSDDEALKTLYKNWLSKKRLLARQYSDPKSERLNIDLQAEEEAVNQLEKELSLRSGIFEGYDEQKLTWQDVQDALQEGEAAVEMVRIDRKTEGQIDYLAMIVSPDTQNQPDYVLLKNGKDLEGKYLKAYRSALRYQVDDEQSYAQFWAPIKEKLKDIDKVYFAPDGLYHHLSLDALFNPGTQAFVWDELDVQRVAGTKVLTTDRKQPGKPKDGFLMGFPDFNRSGTQEPDQRFPYKGRSFMEDSAARFFEGDQIAELPGTRTEIEKLSRIFTQAQIKTRVLTGGQATEENLRNVRTPGILHLATHGFFMKDVDNAGDDDELIVGMDKEVAGKNPLFRSGLLFTGALQALKTGGEGILTAFEAMNLALDNTDLVVMSACETGLGEIQNGEGVYGLQRAFQQAGARSVLMSLWTVSDQATQELMVAFYQNWLQQDLPRRAAFRKAQATLRDKYPHPYFWSAFVMVGE